MNKKLMKIISFCLCLVISLSTLTQTAFAEDINIGELTYFYPIISDNRITAVLQVNLDNESKEMSSSLSKAFSNELEDLLTKKSGKIYSLLTDGNHLQAFDGESAIDLYEIYSSDSTVDLSKSIKCSLSESKTVTMTKLDLMQHNNVSKSYKPFRNIDGPSSYKTVNVIGVSQGNHPWCWAATCAAIINYYKGTNLSAGNVANYVFPNDPEQGGNWSDIKNAYNHWGANPYQTGVITFSNAKQIINGNDPMHLGLSGHSVALIGYEDWNGPDSYDDILILLEPNGGVHKSVTLKSNGNFNYYLSGNDAWIYTRIF